MKLVIIVVLLVIVYVVFFVVSNKIHIDFRSFFRKGFKKIDNTFRALLLRSVNRARARHIRAYVCLCTIKNLVIELSQMLSLLIFTMILCILIIFWTLLVIVKRIFTITEKINT